MDAVIADPALIQRIVVGVGDMAVTNNAQAVLSTYALGSCIGVAAYDPRRRIGGMLHLLLPDSRIAPAKAARQPAMFADTGLPLFFGKFSLFGSDPDRLAIFVAGGASVLMGTDPFRIAERNVRVTLEFLRSSGRAVNGSEVGGSTNRALHLELATGCLALKTPSARLQFDLSR